MNDWLFSNEVVLKTNKWVTFSFEVTTHYFVPTSFSGSIGSQLTKAKIQSQRRAFQKIQKVLDHQNMSYSQVARLSFSEQRLRHILVSLRIVGRH